jgi:threonine dehydratase
MPTATADIKVDAVRGFGGEVLLHGSNFDEAKAKALNSLSNRVLPGCRHLIIRW